MRITVLILLSSALLHWSVLREDPGRREENRSPEMRSSEIKGSRPRIVLFGDSITEQSFRSGGWGASLADTYSRKVVYLSCFRFFSSI